MSRKPPWLSAHGPGGRVSFRDGPRLVVSKVRGHHLDRVMASHRPGGEPGRNAGLRARSRGVPARTIRPGGVGSGRRELESAAGPVSARRLTLRTPVDIPLAGLIAKQKVPVLRDRRQGAGVDIKAGL